MKKQTLCIFYFCFAVVLLTAQTVNQDELSSTANKTIEFINYVGPHDFINTVAEIRGIGQGMGQAVRAGTGQSGNRQTYFVLHLVDPATPSGFDADILFLGPNARVDHIKNLRLIISGYLEKAYGYSQKDADLLALFITIYNAVYRKDIAYFQSKYKPLVLKELTPDNAGLSIRWDEWAGKSRIVIPLTTKPGSPTGSGVATGPISDKQVVQSLKEETGGTAAEQRQQMVDLREEEIQQQEKALAEEKARIAQEEQALQEQQKKLQEQQEQLAGGGQQATVEETEAAKAERAKQQEELARQQEALQQQQAQLEEQKKQTEQQEHALAQQKEEVAQERQAIAEDQKKEIAAQVAAQEQPPKGNVVFELLDPNSPLARLILLDLTTGNRIKKSEINTMRANTAFDAGDYFIAVAGQNTNAGGVVRLVAVSKSTFEVLAQSEEAVFPDARIVKIGQFIYTIIKKDDTWVLGKYDPQKLTLLATSSAVSPWSAIMEVDSKIIIQGPKGSFYLLKPDNLSLEKEIK
ncbi:MAG TPA: P83/100 family protein [Spirochaetales bacterium]|nr:P83/100 family protein [Spirochaetales bacterium]